MKERLVAGGGLGGGVGGGGGLGGRKLADVRRECHES